ncbi:MAG: hypothetical protein ACXU86_20580, partial [Archangium sp.]
MSGRPLSSVSFTARAHAPGRASVHGPVMPSDPPPVLLTTARLNLALLPPDAAARVLAYHEANREHLGPVSPARPD